MTPNEYQELSSRTIAPQDVALARLTAKGPRGMQWLHSLIGLAGEVGELTSLAQKVVWYGREISDAELLKQVALEYGDACFYIAEGLSAFGLRFEDVLQANVDKLRVRFPDRYTDEAAAEENRNREREEGVLRADDTYTTELKNHAEALRRARNQRYADIARQGRDPVPETDIQEGE